VEPVGRRPDKYYPQVSLIQKVQFENLEEFSQILTCGIERHVTPITPSKVTCYLSRHLFLKQEDRWINSPAAC
jgi:hypothetical protein